MAVAARRPHTARMSITTGPADRLIPGLAGAILFVSA
jgi:hypothetical protein